VQTPKNDPGRVHPSNGRLAHDKAPREERRVYGETAADKAAVRDEVKAHGQDAESQGASAS